eukprot:10142458-Lingulodinium_polyedra.AAC.1
MVLGDRLDLGNVRHCALPLLVRLQDQWPRAQGRLAGHHHPAHRLTGAPRHRPHRDRGALMHAHQVDHPASPGGRRRGP